MRIHYLQHVPFEDLATIGIWAADRGHAVEGSRLYRGDAFPLLDSLDLLVILGGPMNVDDDGVYPWLSQETELINEAIGCGKLVLGICLGGQLVARALGARVVRNPHKEIGWFPVSLTKDGRNSLFFRDLPPEFLAFHWHGDTFDIPNGARRLAGSAACSNQAFQYRANVLAMQFHLEYSVGSITRMIDHCGGELVDAPYVQSPPEMVDHNDGVQQMQERFVRVLDAIQDQYEWQR